MKASHFTIPRTLAECQFIPAADPVERPVKQPLHLVKGALWVLVVLAIASAALSTYA
jgi:hypothetical protein